MNWDAIGSIAELVGSVAVLITLIYLSIQIKKTQEIAQAQSYDASRLFKLEQSRELNAHAELIEKANGGEDLTSVEEQILNRTLLTIAENNMTEYFASVRLRKGNAPYIPSQFGFLIARNPAFLKWWQTYLTLIEKGGSSKAADEWRQLVNKRLSELAKGT